MDAPREDLIRMSTSLRHDEDGNTLVGYAAVFDDWAEINSWEGRFRERLSKGAFAKTLRENGDQVKVLFNHGFDPQIGDKPLGKPAVMKEDSRGLYVEVPLDDTSYNADIKALLRSGALDGMSFRMSVKRDDWDKLDEDLPERTIKEVRLYEFGPVTFPAYEATKAGVRAHATRAFKAWQESRGEPVASAVPQTKEDVEPPDGGSTDPDEPAAGHPEGEKDASPDGRTSTIDEPAAGHPSSDAPPTEGHPSHAMRPLTRTRMRTDLEYIEALSDVHLSDDRRGRYSHLT